MSNYIILFIITFTLTFTLTLLIKKIALSLNVVDNPFKERKIHTRPIPLLGGIAIFLGFFSILFFVREYLIVGQLEFHHWFGFFIGGRKCALLKN